MYFGTSKNTFAKRKSFSDSLLNVVHHQQVDSLKIKTYNEIALELMSRNPDSAIYFSMKGLELSEQINDVKGKAISYKNLGTAYFYKGENQKAKSYFLKSIAIYRKIKNSEKSIALIYSRIGSIETNTGNNAGALKIFFDLIRFYAERKDSIGLANTYNNIGVSYDFQGDYDKAIKYYQQSIDLREKLKDYKSISIALNNIGIIYTHKKKFEIALQYFITSLNNSKSIKDERNIAITLGNIGSVYENLNNLELALDYQMQSLEIKKRLGNSSNTLAYSYFNIGSVKQKMKLYAEAKKYFNQSLELTRQTNDLFLMLECYKALYIMYSETKDFASALKYAKLYFESHANIHSKEQREQISRLQSEFDSEVRENQISVLEEEKKAEDLQLKNIKTLIWLSIISFVFILILFAFSIRSFRKRKQLNKKLILYKSEIEEQKEEIINQKNNLEGLYKELNIRKEELQLQHDEIDKKNHYITDSIKYAKFIQEAILPQSTHLQKLIPESFVYFEPKDILSGDFYWVDKLDNILYFALIDSSIHGIPGAFISIIGNNLLNKALNEFGITKPKKILHFLNKGLEKTLKDRYKEFIVESGMDIAVFTLNLENHELTYVGAHNPIYILRNNEILQLKSTYYPLGLTLQETEKLEITEQVSKLEKGDFLYFYSDGFIDQFGGANHKKFMSRQLRDTIIQINQLSCNVQKDTLQKTFRNWKGDGEQVDDVLLIGIKLN